MVSIAVARAIADMLCVPLYHQLLHLVCVPYLPHTATGVNLDHFTLRHLCSGEGKSVVALPHRPTLRQVLDLLKGTTHHMFPVVEELPPPSSESSGGGGGGCASPTRAPGQRGRSPSSLGGAGSFRPLTPHRLRGTVSREDLQVLLALPDFDIGPHAMSRYNAHKPYTELRYEDWVEHENSMFFLMSTAQWQQMWNNYVPDITEEKASRVIDLTIILNRCPFTAAASTNLADAFVFFRTMCLRHLFVVEEDNVVGVVTRKDLLPYRLRRLQGRFDQRLLNGVGLEALDPRPQELTGIVAGATGLASPSSPSSSPQVRVA